MTRAYVSVVATVSMGLLTIGNFLFEEIQGWLKEQNCAIFNKKINKISKKLIVLAVPKI